MYFTLAGAVKLFDSSTTLEYSIMCMVNASGSWMMDVGCNILVRGHQASSWYVEYT